MNASIIAAKLVHCVTLSPLPTASSMPSRMNSFFQFRIFLVAAQVPKRRRCPFLGRYTISNNNVPWKTAASTDQIRGSPQEEKVSCENGKQILSLGCNDAETMEIHSECNSETTASKFFLTQFKNHEESSIFS